jgi:hypothetical protein
MSRTLFNSFRKSRLIAFPLTFRLQTIKRESALAANRLHLQRNIEGPFLWLLSGSRCENFAQALLARGSN